MLMINIFLKKESCWWIIGIMPPKRGVRRGGRRGRGRGAGRNQPTEGQAEQRIPTAPVTHVEFAALSAHMEQRFTELMTAIAQN